MDPEPLMDAVCYSAGVGFSPIYPGDVSTGGKRSDPANN